MINFLILKGNYFEEVKKKYINLLIHKKIFIFINSNRIKISHRKIRMEKNFLN